jgi:heat shock protein HtpX
MTGYHRTALLLMGLTLVFLFSGYVVGGAGGALTALALALTMNGAAYWYSDRLVLRQHHARLLLPPDAQALHGALARLCAKAKLPLPKLYLIPAAQPNAFATGRSPEHGAIAVTQGLLEILNPAEIEAVLAHELAHIEHRDTLLMTITASLAGAISFLGNFAWLLPRGGKEGERPNPLAGLIIALLAPMAAMLVQMAISRSREFAADWRAAELCGGAVPLISALQQLHNHKNQPLASAVHHPATAPLFIHHPLSSSKSALSLSQLFATHPPLSARLEALAGFSTKVRADRQQIFAAQHTAPKPAPAAQRVQGKRGSVPTSMAPTKPSNPWR